MIKFSNITKVYPPNTVVLDDISFEIREGEFVIIAGRSGVGKTTLVKLLIGAEKPTSGEVFFKHLKIHEAPASKLGKLRKTISVIHQDYKLLACRTVHENIACAMMAKGMSDYKIKKEIPKILDLIGLEKKADNFPHQLSGGEKQRVAIARALVQEPELIVADEPTGNLDPYNTYEVISLLKKIQESGKTVILATHDRETINKLRERVITLEDGRIIRDEPRGRFII